MESPVLIKLEGTGNAPTLNEGEAIHFVQPKVNLYLQTNKNEGVGTLYVTNKRVVWLQESAPLGYEVDFHNLMCHAIAKSNNSLDFPQACLYCQLDSEEDVHEIRFVPESDPNAMDATGASGILDSMYKAFSECAILNPDPELEGEGDFVFNEDEILGLGAQQNATLQHLESVLQVPENFVAQNGNPGQFDDAEEDQQEQEQEQDEDVEEEGMEE